MKHRIFALLLTGAFLLVAGRPILAHDYDPDDSDHLLRYAAYAVHPVGVALEWTVTRPIHWLVSRPNLCVIFGHESRPFDKYFEWDNCGKGAGAVRDLECDSECDRDENCGDSEKCGAAKMCEKAEDCEKAEKDCDEMKVLDTAKCPEISKTGDKAVDCAMKPDAGSKEDAK